MRHLAQPPCAELAIFEINLIEKFLFLLGKIADGALLRLRQRHIAIFLEGMIKRRHDRTILPGFNRLFKQGLIQHGQREALCIVDKLLHFHVGYAFSLVLIDQREEIVGDVYDRMHFSPPPLGWLDNLPEVCLPPPRGSTSMIAVSLGFACRYRCFASPTAMFLRRYAAYSSGLQAFRSNVQSVI